MQIFLEEKKIQIFLLKNHKIHKSLKPIIRLSQNIKIIKNKINLTNLIIKNRVNPKNN